jgi:8-oxo-dGTP pyrophosphatase MutT (NUDIX family)
MISGSARKPTPGVAKRAHPVITGLCQLVIAVLVRSRLFEPLSVHCIDDLAPRRGAKARRPARSVREAEECVAREVREETGWEVRTGPIIDSWMYYIERAGRHVFVVTYGCFPETDSEPVLSHEHKKIGLLRASELDGRDIPDGYRRSIATWLSADRGGWGGPPAPGPGRSGSRPGR